MAAFCPRANRIKWRHSKVTRIQRNLVKKLNRRKARTANLQADRHDCYRAYRHWSSRGLSNGDDSFRVTLNMHKWRSGSVLVGIDRIFNAPALERSPLIKRLPKKAKLTKFREHMPSPDCLSWGRPYRNDYVESSFPSDLNEISRMYRRRLWVVWLRRALFVLFN